MNVKGTSFAGGNALNGVVRDGTAVWVGVAVAVADMATFLRIIVGRIIVEEEVQEERSGIVGGLQVVKAQQEVYN